MDIRAQVDLAIDEDRKAPCLWAPTEQWAALAQQLGRGPNRIGVIVYRGRTIREGPPWSDVTTRRPDDEAGAS
ncbi:MAG TPA: hypothetical protein VHW60_07150 [Caulobacteraceae bacterium]|jgi:hypothetical protein|nr:hypothetical protein [Caulobacteraceae bacterium]